MSSKMLSVLSSSCDTRSPRGFTASSERRMESRKLLRRMRLSPIPRHCVPIPEQMNQSGRLLVGTCCTS